MNNYGNLVITTHAFNYMYAATRALYCLDK